jgi:hypothetical protein
MAEINLRSVFMATLMMSFVIVAGMYLIADESNYDPETFNDPKFQDNIIDFKAAFDRQADIDESIALTYGNVTALNPDAGILQYFIALTYTGIQSLKSSITSIKFITDFFQGLSSNFGVPDFVVTFLAAIISIIFIFIIYSAIFGRDQ